ncbi:LytTR family DNA-binding domain-containing protein [Mucilaginibacter sabulilitoris]|uniref:LytTR family DNA-binding domain-containing protein n=1 Tax=Mucilaginibacter sabulilitoris TaxID=1173583 RepID=A0ABZ0TPH6_9SPHI|nr:LytTR family DNA-binding domain-containing protein [Mucilaginibacter sabulilitoris]WPU95042.1 LytTR family DNA-binding domain-containing protein [Mucilaginibacter sabulilitoris]
MNIIIIEDELKAARSLQNIISEIKPQAKITAQLQSVESSVRYLSEQQQPDLIFMDIQLADGLCFEIFKSVKVSCPIIFCTAFDEYSLEAFKANSVDYILKPFSKNDIAEAFKKVDELKNFFQQSVMPDINSLLSQIAPPAGKKSFLVFKHNKYITIATDTIAFFYIRNEGTSIMCFDQQEYSINQSLDQVAGLLSPAQFFRLNRQYLINFSAVKEVEHYFMRKLYVKLVIPTPDKLLVNKEKSPLFLNWLENR